MQQILDETYRESKSEEEFYKKLENKNLKLYFRGKQAGIIANRKYRLKTLGYSKERIQLLDLSKNRRLDELERMVSSRLSQKSKNQEKENER